MAYKISYRERPQCRRVINQKLKEGFTLEDIAHWYESDYCLEKHTGFTKGMELQARKMLQENK